jgi:hypothetical protein
LQCTHGLGGAAGEIVVEERLDHACEKRRALVHHIVRHAELLAGPARIVAILGRAAATDLVGTFGVPQVQSHPHDLVPGFVQQARRDRRVHAPAHRHEHTAPGRQ